MIAFLAVALAGLIIRGPPIRPRSGKPVSATTFDPKDGRVSKVDYFNGPGANANSGLKKISAERSVTFLLDALPQMPLPQKREVRQLPPPPPYPRPMLIPLRAQIATFALDVHGEGVKIAAKNEKLSVQSVWQEAVTVAATAGVGAAAFGLAFIFAYEGMSYKLTGNDIALTASFSATFFAAIFAYFKGRND